MEMPSGLILAPILIALGLGFLFYLDRRTRIHFDDYDGFLAEKRSTLSRDDYKKLLESQRAQVHSMITINQNKGVLDDPRYQPVLDKIEAELSKMDQNLY